MSKYYKELTHNKHFSSCINAVTNIRTAVMLLIFSLSIALSHPMRPTFIFAIIYTFLISICFRNFYKLLFELLTLLFLKNKNFNVSL